MSTQPLPRLSPQQYLAQERIAEFKSEFFQGETFAMAGASREHNLIVANLVREIGNALKDSNCEVYPSEMRVKVSATGLYTYPDVTIACGEPEFEDSELDTLLNPTVLIEVLSARNGRIGCRSGLQPTSRIKQAQKGTKSRGEEPPRFAIQAPPAFPPCRSN